ncbi:MAG TPA: GNAT family N-acetyltransferase [Bacillales bacterium]|nr:GNAT family N-acetyltransferase [Bacillales bacterium]
MTDITIKSLSSIEELEEVVKLDEVIWGMDPVPVHQTYTAAKNGGIVLGAYHNERIVGFLYSFPGFRDGKVYLCSHMMGIHTDYRKRKIGERLKRKQRELALEKGYPLIVWTFDPLQSLNAYLNLHKLGAVAAHYLENHYGEMDDSINAGMPSDRFEVEWRLTRDDFSANHAVDYDTVSAVYEMALNSDGLPMITATNAESFSDRERWLVPIPADITKVKASDHKLALDWRLKTRKAFRQLIDEGFVGVDLVRAKDDVSCYVFVREGGKG